MLKPKGFTLLELIVIISIIGTITTLALAYLQDAREHARDTRRITDLRQLSKALELYYDDWGQYPEQENYSWNSEQFPTTWIPNLVTQNYLVRLPIDPVNRGTFDQGTPWVNTGDNYTYHYSSFCSNGKDCQDYNLLALLEGDTGELSCLHKCWPFNSDNSNDREGEPWCETSSVNCNGTKDPPPSLNNPNYNLKLYSDH